MEKENDNREEDSETKAPKRRNPFKVQQQKEDKERRQRKRARLIVRNISYKATDETLKKHFEQWGPLEEVNLLKRDDGKLVGCAFLQYTNVNNATKAILKANNQAFLGRPVYVDWALGKDEYNAKKNVKDEPEEKKVKIESDMNIDDAGSVKEENSDDDSHINEDLNDNKDSDDDESVSEEDDKDKLNIEVVKKEKKISNDVKEGCTVFIKNVNFDAQEADLRKVCRKYGPIWYAIINRHPVSGHSKGTAFVKFKTKESADMCLQAGTEFQLMDDVLDPVPALSKGEINLQLSEKNKKDGGKDSRNLYLAREGLIMSGSKAAEGLSASDMSKRHRLEQIKTQVLKNLNRFVSRNRLSIHNLPLKYDNEKLHEMVMKNTNLKPHECRVMRENKITAEHPQGKCKGFGFMSFTTHQDALKALRILNNNPKIFGPEHRPIVAFSIEDRAVHKIKDLRKQKSKLNNPTYKEKLEKRKEKRKQNLNKNKTGIAVPRDSKEKVRNQLRKLEKSRSAEAKKSKTKSNEKIQQESFVGTAAKPGTSIRMRSMKKINEQAQIHLKRVKDIKKKNKQQKIKQLHLAERKSVDRPKQGRKKEHDDLAHLVNKYKRMIDSKSGNTRENTNGAASTRKPKRTKWYAE